MQHNIFTLGCTGLRPGVPPDPCTIIIFGASGDLAQREIIPSLYALFCKKLLPEPCAIVGFGRTAWDNERFRTQMYNTAQDQPGFLQEPWQEFAQSLYYVPGDYNASSDYTALANKVRALPPGKERRQENILFHLAVPPSVYSSIIECIGTGPLAQSDRGWRRVVIEKPFGQDEASARALDQQLLRLFREEQIYRIDHFLGKETVQNMLVFRFANPSFEPIWNRTYIDHVQITAAETLGVGSRGGFYDAIGVVRDMVQNHLLHLLCLTAMEPPVRYEVSSLRTETSKLLDAIAPLNVRTDCVVGQYGPGQINDERVPGYREEENIAPDSLTPTFVALKLLINNWRWAGVPFYLRTGKRLSRKLTEITVCFKSPPHLMFPLQEDTEALGNTLTFRLQPDEGILYTFLAKQPGAEICLRPVTMQFGYDTTFGIDHLPSAYQWLLLDAMHGDQTLFPSAAWIYKAWSLLEPIIKAEDTSAVAQFPNYPAGARGPLEAEALIRRAGREWVVR